MSARCTVVVPTVSPSAALARRLKAMAARTGELAVWVVIVDAAEAPAAWMAELRAAGFRVDVLGANRGVGAARNAGFAAAGTEFVLPLDDDDEFDPRLISSGLERFDSSGSKLAFVYSWTRLKGSELGIVESPPWDVVALLKENICSSCALIRRSAWSAVGGYSEDLRSELEDWDLWLKFAAAGYRGSVIEEPLFTYHRRPDSTLSGFRASGRIWELRKRLVERHRPLYEAHLADVIVGLAKDAYGEPGSRLLQVYRYLRLKSRRLLRGSGR